MLHIFEKIWENMKWNIVVCQSSKNEEEKADEPPLQDLTKPVEKKEASEIFVAKPPSNKEPPEIDDTPAEEEEPVKKPRAKRPRSKAQIEHLNRVRGKAVEAAKEFEYNSPIFPIFAMAADFFEDD